MFTRGGDPATRPAEPGGNPRKKISAVLALLPTYAPGSKGAEVTRTTFVRFSISPSLPPSLSTVRERALARHNRLRALRGSFECTVIRRHAMRFASRLDRATSCKEHLRPGLFAEKAVLSQSLTDLAG